MFSSLISMVEKAKRYAEEPERISITGLEVDFRGINGSHRVGLRGDEWSCECEHFHDHGLCAHVMTLPYTSLQRAVPGPWNGFVGGMPPSAVMRTIFPTRTFSSLDASFAPPQPLSPA